MICIAQSDRGTAQYHKHLRTFSFSCSEWGQKSQIQDRVQTNSGSPSKLTAWGIITERFLNFHTVKDQLHGTNCIQIAVQDSRDNLLISALTPWLDAFFISRAVLYIWWEAGLDPNSGRSHLLCLGAGMNGLNRNLWDRRTREMECKPYLVPPTTRFCNVHVTNANGSNTGFSGGCLYLISRHINFLSLSQSTVLQQATSNYNIRLTAISPSVTSVFSLLVSTTISDLIILEFILWTTNLKKQLYKNLKYDT
jgi:hypothetical protein